MIVIRALNKEFKNDYTASFGQIWKFKFGGGKGEKEMKQRKKVSQKGSRI